MSTKWKDKYKPEVIISEIESTCKRSPQKGVEFEGWGFQSFLSILYSMLDFPDFISEIECREILTKSIFTTASHGVLTKDALLIEINNLEVCYQRAPYHNYSFISSLSINQKTKIPSINAKDKRIVFMPKLPKKYQNGINKIHELAHTSIYGSIPSNYLWFKINLNARTIHEATNQALNEIDLIRGIWNLCLNRRIPFRFTLGGRRKPINKIFLGPIHTLHLPNGNLVNDSIFWYENSYIGPEDIFSPDDKILDQLHKFLSFCRLKLRYHPYRSEIQDAIIRYSKALDEKNGNTSFNKLWTVIEFLTNTQYDKYDVTIRRAAFLFDEREFQMELLKHLRESRNKNIHNDIECEEVETNLFQIKYIVETLLWFHIQNHYKFHSISNAAEFLNLPFDKNEIESKVKILNNALLFRGYKKRKTVSKRSPVA